MKKIPKELIKTENINNLIDAYGKLLTVNQLNTLELYYKENLSLSEISEYLKVSRNAVYDTLKKSIVIMENYEKKLKLVEKEKTKFNLLNNFDKYTKEEIKKEIEKL